MNFKDLNIIPEIMRALDDEKYVSPTPIQERAIPSILDGRDIVACAQTGTGKTAAFAVPILQILSKATYNSVKSRKIRTLILTPTRELAVQIHESFSTYGKYTNLRSCVVYGGVSQVTQVERLKRGVDILIATPGRLCDLINQGFIELKNVQIFVLDEADRMLDMGFSDDINKIIALVPEKKQTLLFSATIPPEISNIVNNLLVNPDKIEITPSATTVDSIEQTIYYVDKDNKRKLLVHLLRNKYIGQALVFTRTKHGADRVVKDLTSEHICARAIHGDKSQSARQFALSNFKHGTVNVLVATDIAARGIDIIDLPFVFNYDLPDTAETYVHRIGRTGRAGNTGIAISFCDANEKLCLRMIQKLIGIIIPQASDNPYPMLINTATTVKPPQRKSSKKTISELTSQNHTHKKYGSLRTENRNEKHNFPKRKSKQDFKNRF